MSHDHHQGGMRDLWQVFLPKFVLEVLGGGGAIWGPAEILTLRNEDTLEFWQHTARFASSLFAVRLILELLTHYNLLGKEEKTLLSFLQTIVTKFVLQVLGASGAIWGVSACLTLRNEETQEFWRTCCLFVGFIFFCRYLSLMKEYYNDMTRKGPSPPPLQVHRLTRFLQVFSTKLILEVCGAVGAIWGFSDFMTWRNHETQKIWRFNALTVGLVFLVRYLVQMQHHISSMDQEPFSIKPSTPTGVQLKETVSFGSDTVASCEDEEDDLVDESTGLLVTPRSPISPHSGVSSVDHC